MSVSARCQDATAEPAVLSGWTEAFEVASDVKLKCHRTGQAGAPTVLLIHGLGQTIVDWPHSFVTALADEFDVVGHDNRDAGQSGRLDECGAPPLTLLGLGAALGLDLARPPYRLHDLADDSARIIDRLGIPRVHLVGASMGGMVAQRLALEHPDKVASLTCVMSSSGARGLPGMERRIAKLMSADERRVAPAAVLEAALALRVALAGPLTTDDRLELHDRVGRSATYGGLGGLNGGHGTERQYAAILADRSRAAELARIAAPSLVIHGRLDPLLRVAHGRDLAERLSARYLELPGMGHEVTSSAGAEIAAAVAEHTIHAIQQTERKTTTCTR